VQNGLACVVKFKLKLKQLAANDEREDLFLILLILDPI